MKRWLLALALCWGFTAPATAQSVIWQDLSGNECWNAGQGPGGPSQFLCADVLRNSRQIVTTTIAAAITVGVSTGLTALRYGGNLIVTAQPLAAVITLPPNPFPDGGIVGICNPTAAAYSGNVVTVAGNTGQTSPVGATATITALSAGNCVLFQFNRPNTTWYRISAL